MKKVVHINTYCTGGASKACIRINDALHNSGFDSKMLVLYKTIENELITDHRKHLSFLKNLHLKIKNRNYTDLLKLKNRKNAELFSEYHSVWDVSRNPLVKEADIIHLHWVSGFVDFESFIKAISPKKIIFTLHDYFPFSGGYHYPNSCFESEKWQNRIQKNKTMLQKLYADGTIQFVGPSQYIIDSLLKTGLAKSENCTVIKNPIDANVFKTLNKESVRKQFGFNTTDKVLLYVNENFKYKRKGFSYFKSLLPQLLAKNYKIIICGDESKVFRKDKNIIQTGYVKSDTELAKIYNTADALLFTSQDDNLPNTISESLCCGTPVIAFNAGGIGEMITIGENGSLLNLNVAAPAFTNEVETLFSKNLNREWISKTAHDTYSNEKAATAHVHLYTSKKG